MLIGTDDTKPGGLNGYVDMNSNRIVNPFSDKRVLGGSYRCPTAKNPNLPPPYYTWSGPKVSVSQKMEGTESLRRIHGRFSVRVIVVSCHEPQFDRELLLENKVVLVRWVTSICSIIAVATLNRLGFSICVYLCVLSPRDPSR